jgi:hypothetical protein
MQWILASLVIVSLSGCDTLFPEFAGKPVDAAMPSDGGAGDGGDPTLRLQGVVCIVSDLRDYRTCAAGSPGILRITVEETRQQTMTDPTGHFNLPLSQKIDNATVAIVDPASTYATMIVPLRLQNGIAANLALPVVTNQTLTNVQLANGSPGDTSHGNVVTWVIDGTGAPVAGVTVNAASAFVEGASINELTAGNATRSHGALALLDRVPNTVTLTLTTPPTLALRGDSYTVPVRAAALTATTLVLAPR